MADSEVSLELPILIQFINKLKFEFEFLFSIFSNLISSFVRT
jgi:hypothetical protein